MENNFFIKNGYQHKSQALTADGGGENYWNNYRLDSSKYYQYHVYLLARKLIKKLSFKSCVDVGCGSGYKLMHVIAPTGVRTIGIDQPFIIDRAKKYYKEGEWLTDDFEKPNESFVKSFDLVLCVDVIEHLLNPNILINYLKSLAHTDSLILISTPERDVMHGTDNMMALNKEHIREWNQAEFTSYLTSQGLDVESIQLLPGLKFHLNRRYLSYLRHNWNKQNYNMLAVCRVRK